MAGTGAGLLRKLVSAPEARREAGCGGWLTLGHLGTFTLHLCAGACV